MEIPRLREKPRDFLDLFDFSKRYDIGLDHVAVAIRFIICYYYFGTAVRGRRFDPLTEGNFFCPLI